MAKCAFSVAVTNMSSTSESFRRDIVRSRTRCGDGQVQHPKAISAPILSAWVKPRERHNLSQLHPRVVQETRRNVQQSIQPIEMQKTSNTFIWRFTRSVLSQPRNQMVEFDRIA